MPVLEADTALAFVAERNAGVLVTIKSSDGRPQLSNVVYALRDGRVRVSVTDDRAKTANLRRDPRVSLHVTSDDFWTYVVVEGVAELTAVTRRPGDPPGRALLATYEGVRGPHPDPEEFLAAMVEQRRLEVSFAPERFYPVVG